MYWARYFLLTQTSICCLTYFTKISPYCIKISTTQRSEVLPPPGTQQHCFLFYVLFNPNSPLYLPCNPRWMLRLQALQTHELPGISLYFRRNCCNSLFHCPGWLCVPLRGYLHRVQRPGTPSQSLITAEAHHRYSTGGSGERLRL